MDTVIDELAILERRCARGCEVFDSQPLASVLKKMVEGARAVAASHSGSWLGYHSRVYYEGFKSPPRGARFSAQWGFEDAFSNGTTGEWVLYSQDEIIEHVRRSAGNPDLEELRRVENEARALFDECKRELLATFDAVLADTSDTAVQKLRDEAAAIPPCVSDTAWLQAKAPQRVISSDHEALFDGISSPLHLSIEAKANEVASHGAALGNLAKTARQARLYFEKRLNMKGQTIAKTEGKVFIGHGRSAAWKDLKDFLRDRLHLTPDEFNLEPAAGITTKDRLEEMLDGAVFAFLIMTAEDEHADSSRHARENVVHEAGLFQGRLGFRRAIILLEEGCTPFSNINGLVWISFPAGKLMAASEEIRRVLEREGLLPTS